MSIYDDIDLPEDDTEPDEHGNEPRPCVVCNLDPPEDGPVLTTNRSLFGVNVKLWIDPVCDAHDDWETEDQVERVFEYAGTGFVASAIQSGVFTKQDALNYLPEDVHDKLEMHFA